MNREQAHSQMHPLLLDRALAWEYRMKKAGLPFIYTSVARTTKVQFALYAQGRNELSIVNRYRALAGMPPILKSANERVVTWTLNSQHLTDLDDGVVANDLSRAFDFAIGTEKSITYDVKADVNINYAPDYQEAAELLRAVKLEAGYFWRKRDAPHAQLPADILRELGLLNS